MQRFARNFRINRVRLIGTFVLAALCQDLFAEPSKFNFSIEAAKANIVLRQIAEQSNTQILFALEQAQAADAQAVKGEYTVQAALKLALQGTHLVAQVLDSGAIAVSAISVPAQVSQVSSETETDQGLSIPAGAGALEKVLVTGSLLRRPERSSQLVSTISNQEIVLMGATNAVGILEAAPQNIGTQRTSTTTATTGGLASFANLRALGSENTLTLINGKRIVKSPLKHNAVDFNMMPMAMLESVDVLADGASSIYGSDAVAGVINFRIKDDVNGLQYYAHSLAPVGSGGDARALALSGGTGVLDEDGWNLSVGATWRERKRILTRDRDFSATSVLPDHGINQLLSQAFPANVSQIDENQQVVINNANPYPECAPPVSVPYRGACGTDADAGGFLALQNPEEQASFLSRLSGLTASDYVLSAEYLWAYSEISSGLAPTTFLAIEVPVTSPWYPGAGTVPAIPGQDLTLPVTVASRWTPGGRRTTENSTITDRVLLQMVKEGEGENQEFWLLHSTSNAELRMLDGAYLESEFIGGFSGLHGVYLNPFGAQSAEGQALLDRIRVTEKLIDADGRLFMAGFTLSRDWWDLGAGAVSSALAVEYARESVDYYRNPVAARTLGAVVGGDDTVAASRDRYSITGEVLVPVNRKLEISGSLRFDRYSDFGETVNPKLLVNFDATDRVSVHGSYNTGFRAPTLFNIFTPSTLSFIVGTVYDDPVLCPGGSVDEAAGGIDIRDCSQLYNNLIGGNKDLDPEESQAFTVGIELQPDDSLRVTADFWSYQLDGKIGPLSHASIFGEPERFPGFIVRCSEAEPALAIESRTCIFGGTGDPIAYVVQTNANLGMTQTSGYDLKLSWSQETEAGLLKLDYRGTWVREYEFERVPGDPAFSRAGRYFDGFPVPRYTHYLFFDWQKDDWSAQVQNQFVRGYVDCNAECGVSRGFFNEVDDYSHWNLAVTYDLSPSLSVTAHVFNVFDTDPPFSNGGLLCTGCDTRFANPTGRAFGLTLQGRLD